MEPAASPPGAAKPPVDAMPAPGEATGMPGRRNGLVGARAISSGLAQALGQIEAIGRRFYVAGRGADTGDMADQVFSAFEVH